MHVDDYAKRADRFENELIICGHFSTRYNRKQAEYHVRKRLPDLLGGRLKLWL